MFYVKMLKLKGKLTTKKDNGFLNGGKKPLFGCLMKDMEIKVFFLLNPTADVKQTFFFFLIHK